MTAQACDSIIYEGEELRMHSEPLYDYFVEKGITPNFVPPHTACWRGYIANWEISNGKLYLIGLRGYVDGGNNVAKEVGLDYLFPRRKKVHAQWFSGDLVLLMPRENTALNPQLTAVMAGLNPNTRERVHIVYIEDVIKKLKSEQTLPPELQAYASCLWEKYIPESAK